MVEAAFPRMWLTGWTLLSFWVQIFELGILVKLQQAQILLLQQLPFLTIIVYTFTNTITIIIMFHVFPSRGGGVKHPVWMVINFKRIASPENYHRQPHSIYESLSGRLEACICRWWWECGYLSGQPFLHLKKLCANDCYHYLPFDSKPTSNSAKVLWKNSIKQSCHKMNNCHYFKL